MVLSHCDFFHCFILLLWAMVFCGFYLGVFGRGCFVGVYFRLIFFVGGVVMFGWFMGFSSIFIYLKRKVNIL